MDDFHDQMCCFFASPTFHKKRTTPPRALTLAFSPYASLKPFSPWGRNPKTSLGSFFATFRGKMIHPSVTDPFLWGLPYERHPCPRPRQLRFSPTPWEAQR